MCKISLIPFAVKHLTILHQNIASLPRKKYELEAALENMSEEKITVDIICLTEHFIEAGSEANVTINNFNFSSSYTRPEKRGGSCIYTRKGLLYKELTDINFLSVKNAFECCAIELSTFKLIIVCLYRTPNIHNIDCFMEKMEILFEKVGMLKNKKVVICGDFNIDILKNTKISLDFQNLIFNYNLKIEINQATRIESGTCIDNIIHNNRGCTSFVINIGLSDHFAQILKIPIKKNHDFTEWYINKRCYSKQNLMKYTECLNKVTFSDVYQANDVNLAYKNFMGTCKKYYDICFPVKKCRISIGKRKNKWLTRGIKKSCKTKRILHLKCRKSKLDNDILLYQNYSNILKKVINKSQRIQNNSYILNAANKTKAAWQVINGNTNLPPKHHIKQIKSNEKFLESPRQIANAFNDFFTDTVNETTHSSRNSGRNDILSVPNSVFLNPTTPQYIHKIIKSLKNTNSVGYDGLSTIVIKHCSEQLMTPLSHIINLSIAQGVFPDDLKVTILKPLYKKGDREACDNYRPIALIPVVSKIFERVIYNSFNNFLEKENIFTQEQFGFRKNRSTILAIHSLLNTIAKCLNSRLPVLSVFMDMSKAFDFVCHKTLLSKIYAYGIRGLAYDLIKSYLSNRKQLTEITQINTDKLEVKTMSESRVVKYGVPQGSILGPLLFILYINDLPRVVQNQMVLFADDSTLIVECDKAETYESRTNNAVNNIIEWFDKNNLKINLTKTKVLQFYLPQSHKKDITVMYNDHILEQVNEIKFLGITIDSHISWKTHLINLCKKVSRYVYVLRNLTMTVSIGTALNAYHAFVASNLRYGIIHWGNAAGIHILPLFRAQKKCIRAMCFIKRTESCRPHFSKLEILTLTSMYILEACLFVREHMDEFNSHKSKFPRKTKNEVTILPSNDPKTSFYRNSFFAMGPKIFNHLPDNLKSLPIPSFKRHLQKLLIRKTYYDMKEFFNDNIDIQI
jgi:exonuclease III